MDVDDEEPAFWSIPMSGTKGLQREPVKKLFLIRDSVKLTWYIKEMARCIPPKNALERLVEDNGPF